MTGRDQSHLDDPNRVDPPDDDYNDDPTGLNHERDPDEDMEHRRELLREEGRFGEVQHGKDYPGSLIEDCEAANSTQSLRDVGDIFNEQFTKAKEIDNEKD